MNNREARYILQGYRPNGSDAADPRMAEALEQARRDPELGAWFIQQQAFDKAVADKLQSIRPPDSLKDEILNGLEFARPGRRRRWWAGLSAAAVLLLGLTTYLVLPTRAHWGQFDTFTDNAIAYSAGFISLDYRSRKVPELVHWLKQRNSPLPPALPAGLSNLEGLGCRTISWQGKSISLICFEDDKVYHLFVISRADCPNCPATSHPTYMRKGNMAAATWEDHQRVYLLVVQGSENDLKRLL